MRPLDHLHRWSALSSVALLLWLALVGTGAGAAIPAMQEAWPVAAASGMDTQSMPMASDCIPCAVCCIAPAPASHGFGGEGKEPESPAWWVHTQQTPASVWYADTGSSRCPVPIRITCCRWLD